MDPYLVTVLISTMSSVVEWIDLHYLSMENSVLLRLVFNCLCTCSNSQLQLLCCDFLIDVVSRKGEIKSSADHRKSFIDFLSPDVFDWTKQIIL